MKEQDLTSRKVYLRFSELPEDDSKSDSKSSSKKGTTMEEEDHDGNLDDQNSQDTKGRRFLTDVITRRS